LTSTSDFNKPISFTKNLKESLKTFCGRLTTIIMFIVMFDYFVVLLISPFVKEITTTTETLDCLCTGGTDPIPDEHEWVCKEVTSCPKYSDTTCSPAFGSLSSDASVSFLQ